MVSFFISTAAFLNFNTAVLLFYNKHIDDELILGHGNKLKLEELEKQLSC